LTSIVNFDSLKEFAQNATRYGAAQESELQEAVRAHGKQPAKHSAIKFEDTTSNAGHGP
jgi:hypothetical protein